MKQCESVQCKLLLIVSVGLVAVLGSVADGYRNPPVTAAGIAKSDANKVFVDDASAVFYNPANLAFQEGRSYVASVTFAHLESDFDGATLDDKWQPLPNLFYSAPLGDSGIAFGLGITTPYGQGVEYDKTDLAPMSIYEAQVSLINVNPSVAFKLNDSVAVAVGADIFYSELEFHMFFPWSTMVAPVFFDQNAKAEGDGFGFGGNLALTWNVSDRQRLAFTYRSEVEVEYEGDFKASPNGAAGPQQVNSDFDLDITYPNMIGLGYGIQLTDDVSLEASLEWLEWSSTKSLDADLGVNGKMTVPQDWANTYTFALGGDWQVSDHWILRAGYAFIESPIPDSTAAPSLPDADRHVLSFGVGYSAGGHSLDLAYAYSIYDDRNVSTAENADYPGSYDIDSDLAGMTYSFKF